MGSDQTTPVDAKRGIYSKYTVTRTDGSSGPDGKHEHCAFFVLDLNHDPYAIPALRAYAEACRKEYPGLARDLARIVDAERPTCNCREASCEHSSMFAPDNANEMAHHLMERAKP